LARTFQMCTSSAKVELLGSKAKREFMLIQPLIHFLKHITLHPATLFRLCDDFNAHKMGYLNVIPILFLERKE